MKAPSHHQKAYYHCVSRVVNREFILGSAEKEYFVQLMRMYETLFGLRVLDYTVMSNHFHILVEVPKRPEILPSDAELVALVRNSLGKEDADRLQANLNQYLEFKNSKAHGELRESWFRRMWDVSSYMKMLKQRFTQWYNRANNRTGTLWESRFKSTLVQGEGRALKAIAAYIGLNPVRAGICKDPKDYRWTNYAEALAGKKRALDALHYLTTIDSAGGLKPDAYCPQTRSESLAMWRRVLFGVPEDPRQLRQMLELRQKSISVAEALGRDVTTDVLDSIRKRIPRQNALEVLSEGGELSIADLALCRTRYFTQGVAFGAKGFVEEVFQENREKFGKTRKNGARRLKGLISKGGEDALHTLRDLKKNVFT